MDKNIPDIDRLFFKFLKDHEEEPVRNVWSGIENKLNRVDAETYKVKYKNFKKITACIFLSVALLAGGIFIQNKSVFQSTTGKFTPLKSQQQRLTNNVAGSNSTPQPPITTQTKNELLASLSDNIKKDKLLPDCTVFSQSKKSPVEYSIRISNPYKKPSYTFLQHAEMPTLESLPSSASNYSKDSLLTKMLHSPDVPIKLNQKPTHDFYLSPFFSYDLVTARLKQQYIYDEQDQSDLSERERADISFSIGIRVSYNLSKKLALQSGISLSNLYTSIAPTVVKAVQDNTGAYKFKLATTYGLADLKSTGITNPQNGDSVGVNNSSLSLEYISLPLMVQYNLKPGKFNINAAAGIAVNRIMSEKMEVSYLSNGNTVETINKIEGLKKNFLALSAGAEFNYSVNSNISLGISPLLRYSLTAVNEFTPVKTYPISLGVAALVKIKL